jgi:hypothetical protein
MKSGSLGIHTKFASFLPETGEKDPQDKAQEIRLHRWKRQRIAGYLLPEERVSRCIRIMIQPIATLEHSPKVKRSHFTGIMTCGSVWTCPVCSSKITERRRQELESINYAELPFESLTMAMITVTLQHSRKDTLQDLSDSLNEAWRKIKSGRWWQNFKRKYGMIGSVTGLEVTYGLSAGWHPHKHALFWFAIPAEEIQAEEIQAEIYKRYAAILRRMGHYAHPVHGVNVKIGNQVLAEYVAKFSQEKRPVGWSLEAEVTKAPVKTTKGKKTGLQDYERYTPFELLDLYKDQNDLQAGKLFREYAGAMKGKRQLVWSRGTRDLFGLGEEATDQELAEDPQDVENQKQAEFLKEHWRKIYRNGLHGHIVEIGSRNNREELRVFLAAFGIPLRTDYSETLFPNNELTTPRKGTK